MAVHLLDVVHIFRDVVEQLPRARDEVGRNVVRDSADTDVAHCQTPAAAGFDEIVYFFARPECVPEVADRAKVHQIRADANQVVRDAAELRQDHANILGALGDFDAEHLLDRHGICDAVHHRGHVVQPIGERNHLPIHVRFRHLLETAMQISNLGIGIDDPLAVHGDL